MDSLIVELRKVFNLVLARLNNLIHTAPPGALQLTGILGLAAAVIGYYQLRGAGNNGGQRRYRTHDDLAAGNTAGGASTSGASGAATARSKPKGRSSIAAADEAAAAAHFASLSPLAQAVRNQLLGLKRVTISLPGVLFTQQQAHQLQDAATFAPRAAELLREMASCTDVLLMAHIVDDVGHAVVSGTLEAAGLLGTGPGQVKPHKLLFCSTLEGKVSLVRQLEPDMHIDGHPATVEDLKRFTPQLLHIHEPGTPAAAAGAQNVIGATSLAGFFGQA